MCRSKNYTKLNELCREMVNNVQHVELLGSYPKSKLIPDSNLPEFGFWGRSNVGKSSLINYLCSRKEVARTSSTPGKTQEFNLYDVDKTFLLMDLPGYGYAKASKTKKEKWNAEINKYLVSRNNLCLLFLLIDISIEPQKIDIEKINKLGQAGVPFYILYTKLDKCKVLERKRHRLMMEAILSEFWETLPVSIETSSLKNHGKDEIFKIINKIIKQN